MQKDPGQARESVVTLQQSGPAEPGRGGVSSEGVRVRRKGRRGGGKVGAAQCRICGAEEKVGRV